jgi:hypothetical protein
MYLAKIIVYFSVLIWLLPPFKQIKGGFFLYFLILGYSDPLAFLFLKLCNLNPIWTHFVIAFLLILSLMYYNKTLKLKWVVSLILLMILFLWQGNKDTIILPIIIFRFLALLQILIALAKEFQIKQKWSLYFLILLFYELSVILKFVAVDIHYNPGIYLFYLTSAFEILICLYFTFFNLENSPYIKLQFASENDS